MLKTSQADVGSREQYADRIEVLLFKSDSQLFASRTSSISSLFHSENIISKIDLSRIQSLLPARLLQAFVGLSGNSGVPIFRLNKLLGFEEVKSGSDSTLITDQTSGSGQVIVTWYKQNLLGFAVDQVFEVRSFELNKFGLLPRLVELVRQHNSAWALLNLSLPDIASITGRTETTEIGEVEQLVVLLDFINLFDEAEQAKLDTWLEQAEVEINYLI